VNGLVLFTTLGHCLKWSYCCKFVTFSRLTL
jgi:hypothetical protein